MRKLLIPLLATIALPTAINAAKINCDSPVWRNRPQCKDESGRKKEKTILDEETGLMVIEMEKDIPWSSTSKPKIPYNNIVKLSSSFDGNSEYVVFDRDYKQRGVNQFTVLTKWSSDYLNGIYFLETGCDSIFGCFGGIIDSGELGSPIEIKFNNKNYTLYGDDGQFPLPNDFIEQVKNTSSYTGLSLRLKNRVIPIGEGTVEKLSSLYKKSIKKWSIPEINFEAKNVKLNPSIKEIATNTLPKVVTVKSSRGQGTGFFINDKGLLITNRHVIGSGTKIDIQIETAAGSFLTAKTIYVSRKDDFAILKIQGDNYPKALPICYATYPTAGEEVIAIGSPRGLTNTITRGIVSAFRRSGNYSEGLATAGASLIQTDAAINPGNSGGPLLNNNGEVIGINTFGKTSSGGSQGLNFAVSMIDILQQLNVSKPDLQNINESSINECGNIKS